LWDDVTIEAEAKVSRSVLGDGVFVPSGVSVEDAVIVRSQTIAGKRVPAKALPGKIKGDNFVVCLSQ